MVDLDLIHRHALGILSETVSAQLGASNIVSREVRRAYTSGKSIDLFTARAAFNALPGWQRRRIGNDAVGRARVLSRDTGRDWRDLPPRDGWAELVQRRPAGER